MAGRSLRLRNWQRWLLGGCLALGGCHTGNHFPSFPPIHGLREAYRTAAAAPAGVEPPPRWAQVPLPGPVSPPRQPAADTLPAPGSPAQPPADTQPLVITVKLRAPDPPAAILPEASFPEPKPLHLPLTTEAASRPLVVDYGTVMQLACGDTPRVREVGRCLRDAFHKPSGPAGIALPPLGACRGFAPATDGSAAPPAGSTVPAMDAATNLLLHDTALAYLRLLEAYQQRAVAVETLGKIEHLTDLTGGLVKAGRGSAADNDRARAELSFRRNNVFRSEEHVLACSARLRDHLRAPADVRVVPRESTLGPCDLCPDAGGVRGQIQAALRRRPELGGCPLVALACQHLGQSEGDTWLPSSLPGLKAVSAVTEAKQRSQLRQLDDVARQVAEARGQVQVRRLQVLTAEEGVRAATEGFKREIQRLREGQGLVIETVQALQTCDLAWREYVRTVAAYDEAQLRLFWALGYPAAADSAAPGNTCTESTHPNARTAEKPSPRL